MLAQSIGGGPLEAYCLVKDGRHSRKFTTGQMSCDKWAGNDLGAVDSPDFLRSGVDAIEYYAQFDAKPEK